MYRTQYYFSFEANRMNRKISVIQFVSVCLFVIEAYLAQGLERWPSKPGVRSFNLR